MHKPSELLLVAAIFVMSACKEQHAPTAANTNLNPMADYKAQPATPEQDTRFDARPMAAKANENANAQANTDQKDLHAADDRTEMNEQESTSYHQACHFILSRMASCAKDPGFIKYQARWVAKGAPRVTAKEFEKKIMSWSQESSRARSCKEWNRLPNTRTHFASTSHLAALREDAKLSCELFGQELDDDGWFPAALIGS